MQDVHPTVAALGEAIGMNGVAFDGNGDLTLIVDDRLVINLHKVDGGHFELWADLPDLGNTGDPGLLASALAANHLGEGTGAARLALRPDRSGFVLCQRVGVAGTDVPAVVETLAAFVASAGIWASGEGRRRLDGAAAPSVEVPGDGFSMIRV